MKAAASLAFLLLAGCATAARVHEPVVLDFRWNPAFNELTSGFGRTKEIEREQEMLGLVIRNQFETRFENIALRADPKAPVRVALTVSEFARPAYADRLKMRGGTGSAGTSQRCGTVDYVVYSDGREVARDEFQLDCDAAGRPDYQRAGLRAAGEAARALGGA